MQKFIYVLMLFAITAQCVFAQQRTASTVYLKNGSVVKGKVLRSKTTDRIKVETPDGSVVFFTENAIKEVVREPYKLSTQEPANTIHLTNGSVIHGKVTETGAGRMKAETASGCVIFFTERSVKNIAPYGEEDLGGDAFAATATTRQRTQSQSTSRATAQQQQAQQQQQPLQPAPMPEKTTGYHGIFEAGYSAGMGDISTSRIEITTSHGIQMNNRLFIGLGLGVNLYSDGLYYESDYYKSQGLKFPPATEYSDADTVNMKIAIPIFADFRINFLDRGKVIPFAGIKAGYTVGLLKREWNRIKDDGVGYTKGHDHKFKGVGFYAQPNVGVKFMIGETSAVNLSVGYAFQSFDHYYYPMDGGVYKETAMKKTKNNGAINFRVGFEF